MLRRKKTVETPSGRGRHRPRLSRMLRVLKFVGILIFVVGIAAAAYVRIVPISSEEIDFRTLKLSDKPNQYLVCPSGLCKNATPHRQSPEFAVSAGKLLQAWSAVAMAAPRTEAIGASSALDGQVTIVQRSKWMAYPDLITIAVASRGPGKSSFALYSRAIYGRKGFGVNQARIEAWMEDLKNRIAKQTGQ